MLVDINIDDYSETTVDFSEWDRNIMRIECLEDRVVQAGRQMK
jgi:hypothetical protein